MSQRTLGRRIHKLIVADRRKADHDRLKARKDRAQAEMLIEVLSEERPGDLVEAYEMALAQDRPGAAGSRSR